MACTPEPVRMTSLEGAAVVRGKVRDVYDLGDELLIVATDRISAFDCVLPDPIPQKGRVLTAMSEFWFDHFGERFPHHLIEVVTDQVPAGFEPIADQIRGRAMRCKKAKVVPIECVARGYITGSGWKDYCKTQQVCGIPLPAGLQKSQQLPEPIFTPSTKATVGHDENISFEEACNQVGEDVMKHLREATLTLYQEAADFLRPRGIILADTKFEFGATDSGIILIDEVLTPDSSRFWPADKYEVGREQESFDKQFVRNHLQVLCDDGQWDKTDPAPALPADVIAATTERYREAFRIVTGKPLS